MVLPGAAQVAARSPTCYTSSTLDINGSFAHGVLDDKLLFAKFFSQQLPIPQIVAVIERGEVFAQGGVTRDAGGVLNLAERHTSVVFKPSDGSRGRGIFRLNTNPETLNGGTVTDAEVDDFV